MIEAGVEAQDPCSAVTLHDRHVHRISCGERCDTLNECFRTLYVGDVDRSDLVDDAEQCVKCRSDRLASIDGHVALQDCLQHLSDCIVFEQNLEAGGLIASLSHLCA